MHFQFFGLFLLWIIALLFRKLKFIPEKYQISALIWGVIFSYAHSLDYNFDHTLIYVIGGMASIFLLWGILRFIVKLPEINSSYKLLYLVLLLIAVFNLAGSIPGVAQLVVDKRFVLIAWLHLLFLGLFAPFIWVFFKIKIHRITWVFYILAVSFTEALLVFPNKMVNLISIPIWNLLLIGYLLVSILIGIIHTQELIRTKNQQISI